MNTLDYFKKICQIPRESGNEEGMRNFLLKWADENGFESATDKAGDVFVYCKATPGFENASPIAFQGHMDMVCVKREGSKHDFTKDPIETYEKDGWLRAKDTSLGADNGIAVAMIMALFTDKKIEHGRLEALFTVSEETHMVGAFNFDTEKLKARKLINLDSEEEGVIYVGCAGGLDLNTYKKVSFTDIPSDYYSYTLSVKGMKGGHSGGEIHLGRANATKVLAELLSSVKSINCPIMLSSFQGGTRSNVIPSSATCTVHIPKDLRKEAAGLIIEKFNNLKEKYKNTDPDMSYEILAFERTDNKALSEKESLEFVELLLKLNHGVTAMSRDVKGVVETSDNIAITTLDKDYAKVRISVRSLIEEEKHKLCKSCVLTLSNAGFECKIESEYPGWKPNVNSELTKFCIESWKEYTGKDPIVTSIHAGLECGVINSRISGMDSVSIGPDLQAVHSVDEGLRLSSIDTLYGFLCSLLKKL